MQSRYSLVFYPSEAVMETVWQMKQQLYREIGWYNSKNSKAHITIFNFILDDETHIPQILKLLGDFAAAEPSFDVCLDSFQTVGNSAFCLMPETAGASLLKNSMARLQSVFHLEATHRSDKPHVSIGRKLNPQQLIKAKSLFTQVNLSFRCDRLVLRIFDPTLKQYREFKEFALEGESA